MLEVCVAFEQLLAEEGSVLDILEEADLDGRVGEVRECDGLHGGGEVGGGVGGSVTICVVSKSLCPSHVACVGVL